MKYNHFSEISNYYFYFNSNNLTAIEVNYSTKFITQGQNFSWLGDGISLSYGWQEVELDVTLKISD